MKQKQISILGSTGSVGKSTLDVIARHPQRYQVHSLIAQRSVDSMFEQCVLFKPQVAVLLDETAAKQLRQRCAQAGLPTKIVSGAQAIVDTVSLPEVDSVMAAIVGGAGLLPSLAAAQAGKTILLANKEALVMAGELFLNAAQHAGSHILPIDSEHNAIFQCLPAPDPGHSTHQNLPTKGIHRIVLTASGGPFLRHSADQLQHVTPDQACAHPKWSMGRKISTDSATLMNKGLELIEAQYLFGLPAERLEAIIHPQSIVHSFVDYIDGSMLAQLGNPDMRVPIAHALAYPDRTSSGVAPLDLARMGSLHFEAPDLQQFPCLRLASEVLKLRGNCACVLNAANEIAVESFLQGELPFLRIAAVIERTLAALQSAQAPQTLDEVLALDVEARSFATRQL